MPLSDFVRYLNAQLPYPPSGLLLTTPFVSEGHNVHVIYSGLRLESAFCPVIDPEDGRLRGHGARLLVVDEASNRPLDPAIAYALPRDDQQFIVLDRLVRTLHTLNYLTYRDRQSRELLLLKVHPRHVASVAVGHGLAFEEILRSCGLMPGQITLEFDVLGAADVAHLERAIVNYRSRGYGIAIGGLAGDDSALSLLRRIRPAIVRVDRQALPAGATRPPRSWVDQLHGLGAQVISAGPDSSARRAEAHASGVDLLQVQAPLPRLLHAPAPASTPARPAPENKAA